MREMRLKSVHPERVSSEGWLDGEERVFVLSSTGGISVGFKVYAASDERRSSVEMLLGFLHGDCSRDICFLIKQDMGDTVLWFTLHGQEFEVGDVPGVLSEELFGKYWEEVGKRATLDEFSVEMSVAGREVDRDCVMRMADDEESLNGMSDRAFDRLMSSIRNAVVAEVYVVKVRLTIADHQGLLRGGVVDGC